MTNRKSMTARLFESLAILHLSQPLTALDRRASDLLSTELRAIDRMTDAEFAELLFFAALQRVEVRTLQILADACPDFGMRRRSLIQQRVSEALREVEQAVSCLSCAVAALEQSGITAIVIKTLDHWPDIGSDLDLFASGNADDMCRAMTRSLGAEILPQSWGDKLACKWNFKLPGLPQPVEVHLNRLGQTGEQSALPLRVLERSREGKFGGFCFRVPAPEERVAIATLQRMYRHFYIRLTDIVNITKTVRASELNFQQLRQTAEMGALWPGAATLLRIVSDYNARYAQSPLDLPAEVAAAARFGGESTYLGGPFLRVPLVPQAADLYLRQWVSTGAEHRYRALSRLSLLPLLATAAFMNLRLTGSDKGIW